MPDTLTDAQLTGRPLLLYGTPAANPVLARVLAAQDIALAGRRRSRRRRLPAGRESRAHRRRAAPALARAARQGPHGLPRGGRARRESLLPRPERASCSVTGRTASRSCSPPWTSKPVRRTLHGRRALALGPASLSAAEAQADLAQLHALAQAKLRRLRATSRGRCRGRVRAGRRAREAWHARLGERERWSWADFFAAVADYLAPVQDAHFYIQGSSGGRRALRAEAADLRPPVAALLHRHPPARDGRAACAWSRRRRAAALRWRAKLLAPPVLSSPHAVVDGQPLRFPTLPARTGEQEYLLGCLSTEAGDSLALSITLRTSAPAAAPAAVLAPAGAARDGRPAAASPGRWRAMRRAAGPPSPCAR